MSPPPVRGGARLVTPDCPCCSAHGSAVRGAALAHELCETRCDVTRRARR